MIFASQTESSHRPRPPGQRLDLRGLIGRQSKPSCSSRKNTGFRNRWGGLHPDLLHLPAAQPVRQRPAAPLGGPELVSCCRNTLVGPARHPDRDHDHGLADVDPGNPACRTACSSSTSSIVTSYDDSAVNGRGRLQELGASGNLIRGLVAPVHSPQDSSRRTDYSTGSGSAKIRRRWGDGRAILAPARAPREAGNPHILPASATKWQLLPAAQTRRSAPKLNALCPEGHQRLFSKRRQFSSTPG